jgi:tetratricopeptide (TPR) repeat protein
LHYCEIPIFAGEGFSLASVKDKYLDTAQKLIAKGMYDKAAKEYRALLQVDSDIRHRQRLAELLVKSGERDEAVEEYKAISRYYADNHFLLKAIAVLKQVQKLVPDDVGVTLTLADLNHRQGLTGNSLTEYQAALAYYEKRHNTIDAVEVLKRMLAVDPENLKVRITLAERRFSIGQQDEACEDFKQVAERVRQQGDDDLYRQIKGRMATLFPGRGQEVDPLAELSRRLRGGDAAGVIAPLLSLAQTAPSREVADLLLDASRRTGNASSFRVACRLAICQSADDPGPRRGLLGLTLQEEGGAAAVSLLEEWSADLTTASRLPLLYALCRETVSAIQGDAALMQRLAAMDPSLAPVQPAPLSVPERSEPGAEEEPSPPAPPSPAAPPDAHHWEEDLELDIAGAEPPVVEQEELLDLEPLEEEPPEPAMLQPVELEEGADLDAGEQLIPVTLTPEMLSRQDWSLPAGVGAVSCDEVALGEPPCELEVLEPEPAGMLWPDVRPEDEGVFSLDELADFGAEFLDEGGEAGAAEVESKYSFDGLFSEFKRGVDSAVDSGDTETHFNLGIAYKEMGLLDDAIASFAAASVNPARRVDSILLQGICHQERGDVAAAEAILRKGVEESASGSEGIIVLLYELASLLEGKGEPEEARELFERAHRLDPLFRDLPERLARLGGSVAALDLADAELVE